MKPSPGLLMRKSIDIDAIEVLMYMPQMCTDVHAMQVLMLWRTSGSALISPLGYLNLHFHNQTAGLSMSYMNISKNKANRLNYE